MGAGNRESLAGKDLCRAGCQRRCDGEDARREIEPQAPHYDDGCAHRGASQTRRSRNSAGQERHVEPGRYVPELHRGGWIWRRHWSRRHGHHLLHQSRQTNFLGRPLEARFQGQSFPAGIHDDEWSLFLGHSRSDQERQVRPRCATRPRRMFRRNERSQAEHPLLLE